MKKILFLLFIVCTNTVIFSQASVYFPSAVGQKWYFKSTPTDTLNNPIDSLATYSIDSFAVVTTYADLTANVILGKTGLEQTVPFQPYTDTSYINLDGNNAKTYLGLSAFTSLLGVVDTTGLDSLFGGLADLIARLASFEGWYTPYRFNNNINSTYTYFQYDTIITIDTVTLPVRFELRGKRIADIQLETEIGTFQTKRFVNSFVFSYLLGIPPFVLPIGLLTVRDTIWFAPDKWIVQSHVPASGLDLTVFGLPSFMLPGIKVSSIPEIIVTGTSESSPSSPAQFQILQNFPNPFNPETNAKFNIQEPGEYRLTLFNAVGEYIRLINSRYYLSGSYQEILHLNGLPSGVYILHLSGGGMTSVLKINLMK